MSYTIENQEIKEVTNKLKENFKDFRERAENRIMDTNSWNTIHRLKLKSLVDKMFGLQIELNEL